MSATAGACPLPMLNGQFQALRDEGDCSCVLRPQRPNVPVPLLQESRAHAGVLPGLQQARQVARRQARVRCEVQPVRIGQSDTATRARASGWAASALRNSKCNRTVAHQDVATLAAGEPASDCGAPARASSPILASHPSQVRQARRTDGLRDIHDWNRGRDEPASPHNACAALRGKVDRSPEFVPL